MQPTHAMNPIATVRITPATMPSVANTWGRLNAPKACGRRRSVNQALPRCSALMIPTMASTIKHTDNLGQLSLLNFAAAFSSISIS